MQARPVNISMIQVYAPTSTASDEDIESFYTQLQDALDDLPKSDISLVIGDFNAKIGNGILQAIEAQAIGQHGLGTRNDRGNMLIDFCLRNDLTVTNTMFYQHPRRLYTWQGPGGKTRNQIEALEVFNQDNKDFTRC